MCHQWDELGIPVTNEAEMPGSRGQRVCGSLNEADITFIAPVRWHHRGKSTNPQRSPSIQRLKIDLRVELRVTCWTHVKFWRYLSHTDALQPTRTHTHTHTCLIFVHVCGIMMSRGGVTCCCMWQHSCAVSTGRGVLWDRSDDSSLWGCSRCRETIVFPLAPISASCLFFSIFNTSLSGFCIICPLTYTQKNYYLCEYIRKTRKMCVIFHQISIFFRFIVEMIYITR